ncbi:Transposase [Candidatus Jidaibacter acanthamoeba]|uniref:Transposase n=1 Tax=Candidatus Jidaibacter acanthamoebae TaxID=86105 RepID=A0A0C1MUF2_9RICK|nr:DDE-type integrase/transposase/recombinase [Candidatus Jidaibacter acanthamoeba]KIE05732.1 Transposase [Candidatus Jidaibacter acanthamoeba]
MPQYTKVVIKFVKLINIRVRKHKKAVGNNWRMDEAINGSWMYLYRAVDSIDNIINFKNIVILLQLKHFFHKAMRHNGRSQKVTINKSGNNTSALNSLSKELS